MTDTPPQQKKFGIGMWIAAWGILLLLLVFWFQEQLTDRYNPNRQPETEITASGARVATTTSLPAKSTASPCSCCWIPAPPM